MQLACHIEVKEGKKEKKGNSFFLLVTLKGGGPTGFRQAGTEMKFPHISSSQTCRCD